MILKTTLNVFRGPVQILYMNKFLNGNRKWHLNADGCRSIFRNYKQTIRNLYKEFSSFEKIKSCDAVKWDKK